MKIANLIRKRPREAVATAIPAIPATELGSRAASVAKIATVAVANAADLGEGGEQAVAGIATVAVAKPNKGRVEGTAPPIRATRWLIHFLDREPLEVWFAPAADHDEALAAYKDAVAAEPLAGVSVSAVSASVSAESTARGCSTCRHRKRPGLSSPGYCSGRDDLPGAYGDHHPLRRLPDDQGASCTSYRPHED